MSVVKLGMAHKVGGFGRLQTLLDIGEDPHKLAHHISMNMYANIDALVGKRLEKTGSS